MPRRSGVSIQTTIYQRFRGADFSTDPALVDSTRSPLCTNMISDGGGMPEKRCGWRTVHTLGKRINGLFSSIFEGRAYFYAHAGTELYTWDESENEPILCLSGLNDDKSRGVSLGGKYWIVTGGEYLCCEGSSVRRVSEGGAYIPTTVITREPTGGGVTYEEINLITPYRRNGFQTDGEATSFLLDSDSLDTAFVMAGAVAAGTALHFLDSGLYWLFTTSAPVEAGELVRLDFEAFKAYAGGVAVDMSTADSASGTDILTLGSLSESSRVTAEVWGEPVENFTVNRAMGTVVFAEAPAKPFAGAADGLTVTFPKTVEGYADMANRCRIITTYGAGTSDRIVISGNPDYPNREWISGLNDPTYFPDLSYSVVGIEDVAIMGYCRIGSSLAVVKEDNGQDSTVYFRTANVDSTGAISFPLQQALTGVGAVSRGSFATLLDEPLFVSGTGIYAVSVNYLTGDRAGQNRSFYLNAQLLSEDLAHCEAVAWNGMYLLSFPNGHVYVLDGRQTKTYRSESLGDFVYEGYYWEHVPALCWLNYEHGAVENLFFGTEDGRICRFNTDIPDLSRYSDDNEAIDAIWATKMDDDGCATILKTMIKRGCAVTLKPHRRSSAQITCRTDRDAVEVAASGAVDIFDWEDIDFSRLSFDSNDGPREIFFNTKVKKYKRLAIYIRNNTVNEGFGVFAITKNFVKGNYAKR